MTLWKSRDAHHRPSRLAAMRVVLATGGLLLTAGASLAPEPRAAVAAPAAQTGTTTPGATDTYTVGLDLQDDLGNPAAGYRVLLWTYEDLTATNVGGSGTTTAGGRAAATAVLNRAWKGIAVLDAVNDGSGTAASGPSLGPRPIRALAQATTDAAGKARITLSASDIDFPDYNELLRTRYVAIEVHQPAVGGVVVDPGGPSLSEATTVGIEWIRLVQADEDLLQATYPDQPDAVESNRAVAEATRNQVVSINVDPLAFPETTTAELALKMRDRGYPAIADQLEALAEGGSPNSVATTTDASPVRSQSPREDASSTSMLSSPPPSPCPTSHEIESTYGFARHDLNGNGLSDMSDPGVAGVVVRFDYRTVSGSQMTSVCVTGSSGKFVFDTAPPGTSQHRLHFEAPQTHVVLPHLGVSVSGGGAYGDVALPPTAGGNGARQDVLLEPGQPVSTCGLEGYADYDACQRTALTTAMTIAIALGEIQLIDGIEGRGRVTSTGTLSISGQVDGSIAIAEVTLGAGPGIGLNAGSGTGWLTQSATVILKFNVLEVCTFLISVSPECLIADLLNPSETQSDPVDVIYEVTSPPAGTPQPVVEFYDDSMNKPGTERIAKLSAFLDVFGQGGLGEEVSVNAGVGVGIGAKIQELHGRLNVKVQRGLDVEFLTKADFPMEKWSRVEYFDVPGTGLLGGTDINGFLTPVVAWGVIPGPAPFPRGIPREAQPTVRYCDSMTAVAERRQEFPSTHVEGLARGVRRVFARHDGTNMTVLTWGVSRCEYDRSDGYYPNMGLFLNGARTMQMRTIDTFGSGTTTWRSPNLESVQPVTWVAFSPHPPNAGVGGVYGTINWSSAPAMTSNYGRFSRLAKGPAGNIWLTSKTECTYEGINASPDGVYPVSAEVSIDVNGICEGRWYDDASVFVGRLNGLDEKEKETRQFWCEHEPGDCPQ